MAVSVRSRPATVALVLGDLLAIALFVYVGAATGHGYDPVGQFGRLTITFSTFVLGWAIGALAVSVYADRSGIARTAGRTALAWAIAVAVAMALRATPLPGDPAPTFALVAALVGLALLVPWHIAVGLATR